MRMPSWIRPLLIRPRHESGELDDQQQADCLDHNERDDSSINGGRRYLWWGYYSQIDEGKSEGWRQKRHLEVHSDHHAKPDQVHTQGSGSRHDQWDDNEGDLKEVDKESQQKNSQIGNNKKADNASGKVREKIFDP